MNLDAVVDGSSKAHDGLLGSGLIHVRNIAFGMVAVLTP